MTSKLEQSRGSKETTYKAPYWAEYQLTRSSGLVEDVCEHGVGHPNKEWLAKHPHRQAMDIHGCDGCCINE